ncbi:MAG TPA: hypothetical protein VIJ62_06215 [Rhizomicrobium sp.]
MAIREFSPVEPLRARIAFVGPAPTEPDMQRFLERNLDCEICEVDKIRDQEFTASLDAVIWTQDRNKPNALARELGEIIPDLLNRDVRVYIRLAVDDNQTELPRKLVVNALQSAELPVAKLFPAEWLQTPEHRRERENGFLLPCVYIFDAAIDWPRIANVACSRLAGPSPASGPTFDEKVLRKRFGDLGHDERILLLRRAFWDCDTIRLIPLDGGMSGAPVFRVYAELRAGFVPVGPQGVHPHVYFVKMGPRKKIIDEYDKYRSYIFEYVPFYLGPRLRPDKCNLGSSQGILVGDFVEGAESLIGCAQGGRSGHAIANLFGKTLGGWRKQGRLDSTSLSVHLARKWNIEGKNELIGLPEVREKIVRALGCDPSVTSLKAIFEQHANTLPLCAPAHGDLHATNVLVRHGDAIIIDFEKLEKSYPLPYDPASLEAGLLVEGFVRDLKAKRITPKKLVKAIAPLYELPTLQKHRAARCTVGDEVEWFYEVVNQIRTLSWSAENERGQYALTLALCLIRKGCNIHSDLEKKEQNESRAVAFYFGQRILDAVAEKQPKQSVRARRV